MKQELPDFRTLALEHIARGFWVSATKPGVKDGFHGWNTYNLLSSVSSVDRFLKKYPQCATSNVAVFCTIGMHYEPGTTDLEGNLFVLDVDGRGVFHRIKNTWGLPETYMVQSRPVQKPWKVHIYFRHTKYSEAAFRDLAKRFGKKTKEHSGIRDFNSARDERDLHENMFDVKGSGKGGYVLGHGSVHSADDGGEMYTRMNTLQPLPVPNAFCDQLVEELNKFYDEVDRQNKERVIRVKKVLALSAAERKRLHANNDPAGFFFTKEETFAFLQRRARFLASQGLPVDLIKEFLIRRCPDVCHDGKAFVRSAEGQKRLDYILGKLTVNLEETWIKNLAEHFEDVNPDPKSFRNPDGHLVLLPAPTNKQRELTKVAMTFPALISSSDVYRQFGFSAPPTDAQRKLAGRVMRATGRKSVNVAGKRHWEQTEVQTEGKTDHVT